MYLPTSTKVSWKASAQVSKVSTLWECYLCLLNSKRTFCYLKQIHESKKERHHQFHIVQLCHRYVQPTYSSGISVAAFMFFYLFFECPWAQALLYPCRSQRATWRSQRSPTCKSWGSKSCQEVWWQVCLFTSHLASLSFLDVEQIWMLGTKKSEDTAYNFSLFEPRITFLP